MGVSKQSRIGAQAPIDNSRVALCDFLSSPQRASASLVKINDPVVVVQVREGWAWAVRVDLTHFEVLIQSMGPESNVLKFGMLM